MDLFIHKADGRKPVCIHVLPDAHTDIAALYKIDWCEWNGNRSGYRLIFNWGRAEQAVHWIHA